jgi:hypothetical protein
MTSFLALYEGQTVATSEIVALTANPELVREFAHRLVINDVVADTTPTPEAPYVDYSASGSGGILEEGQHRG